MKTIRNRIEKIEQSLSIGKEILRVWVILSCKSDEELRKQLGPVEQWESYKQVEAQYPDAEILTFMADPQIELIARQRPLTEDEIAVLLQHQPQVA
jgi:hypothetical protein